MTAKSNVIAIGAHPSNELWLNEMLPSLEGVKYPIYIVVNDGHQARKEWLDSLYAFANGHGGKLILIHRNGFSPAVVEAMVRLTDYEGILHLHDSCFIKDQGMFDLIFDQMAGRSVSLSHNYLMMMGCYQRKILAIEGPPRVETKRQEHDLGEFGWTRRYIQAAGDDYVALWPTTLTDTKVFIEKHGKTRMVLENEYMIKWKGTWDASMIQD